MARNVMDQLISNGKVERGHLGDRYSAGDTGDCRSVSDLKESRGVIISEVSPNSAAARAGMQRGDVVVAFNDTPVVDGNALRNAIAGSKPGTPVKLTILRNGKEQTIEAKLDEYRGPEKARRRDDKNNSLQHTPTGQSRSKHVYTPTAKNNRPSASRLRHVTFLWSEIPVSPPRGIFLRGLGQARKGCACPGQNF